MSATIRSFLFICVIFALAGWDTPPSMQSPYRYESNREYNLQKDFYDIYSMKQAAIVMLGDSITDGVKWNELLNRNDIVSRGISGDTTEGILNRMGYVYKLEPKVCFILGGVNDFKNNIPEEDVLENIKKIVTELKAHHIIPVIQSTLYVSQQANGFLWGFSANQFQYPMSPQALIRAMEQKGKIKFPYANRPIELLNSLLTNPNLFGIMKIRTKQLNVVINRLESGKTIPFRELIQFNRLLIEVNYPLETPKSEINGINYKVYKLNGSLMEFAQKNNVDYIDLNKVLSKDHILIEGYTIDGVHLNAKGYKLWADQITPIINKF